MKYAPDRRRTRLDYSTATGRAGNGLAALKMIPASLQNERRSGWAGMNWLFSARGIRQLAGGISLENAA
jgi:hypothetical protein